MRDIEVGCSVMCIAESWASFSGFGTPLPVDHPRKGQVYTVRKIRDQGRHGIFIVLEECACDFRWNIRKFRRVYPKGMEKLRALLATKPVKTPPELEDA
jgi:hypothetical protein